MLRDLRAEADLRGHRIDLRWAWEGTGPRPGFRLLRSRRAYPTGPADGYPVLDLAELFRAPAAPWARVSRVRYLVAGSPAEGGLTQAEVAFFHEAPGASAPLRVEVSLLDRGSGMLRTARIDDLSRVEHTSGPEGPWGAVERLRLRRFGPGGEEPAGELALFRDPEDGSAPARLRWAPPSGAPREVELDAGALAQTRPEVRTLTALELSVAWSRVLRRDGWSLADALSDPEDVGEGAREVEAEITLHELFGEDTGDWTRSVRVHDLGAAVEETSYYALFRDVPGDPGAWSGERSWRAHAAATARYGFPERLYALLPEVHRRYDEPERADRGRGQLRRFAEVFGVTLDHLRSGAEILRGRHDLETLRGDLLPALGRWVDWSTDHTAPLPVQRREIGMARAVYETVGTLPNLVALASRVTGWECRATEFVHNLFLTNAPEHVPIRELREAPFADGALGAPVTRTSTPRFDGRPAPVAEEDGRVRLFWHSNRAGRWELWTSLLDGASATPPSPAFPPPPDTPAPEWSETSPTTLRLPGSVGGALWLFWESDREGAWDIWGRTREAGAWGAPFRVTDHRAPDRRPAAALGPDGTLWVFWESERRGRPEIWCRALDDGEWTPAARVTGGTERDREPAAALDGAGRLWLVWRRDRAEGSRLYARVLEDDAWGEEVALEDGSWRDESPTLVRDGGLLRLVWSSERTGRWELWSRAHDGAAWSDPVQLTLSPDPDRDPAAVDDGSGARLFWRIERPAPEHRSRTVDTRDTRLLEGRGGYGDRIHYTYDTRRGPEDRYARDVVGVFVTPPPGTSPRAVEETLDRARSYLEPFVPANVRLVLHPWSPPGTTDFHTDGTGLDAPIADAYEDRIEDR